MDFELFARFVPAADGGERVRVPKIAGQKRRLRRAEIVFDGVAHDAPVAHQFPPDRLAGPAEPFIRRADQTETGQQQHAGVEIRLAEGAGEGAARFAPRFGENSACDGARATRPILRALLQIEPARDLAEAVAGGPAQRRRIGVDPLSPTIFPNAGVRLEREFSRPFAKRLELAEQSRIAHFRQPLVDEHLLGAEHDAAVGVMLQLPGRLIADAHGPVPEIPLEVGRDHLVERGERHDALHRLHVLPSLDRDGRDIVYVGFHRVRGAEPI